MSKTTTSETSTRLEETKNHAKRLKEEKKNKKVKNASLKTLKPETVITRVETSEEARSSLRTEDKTLTTRKRHSKKTKASLL